MALDVQANRKALTEEEAAQNRQFLKNKLTVLGLPVAGLVPAVGAAFASDALLNEAGKYPAVSEKEAGLVSSIINAHTAATGTKYPHFISPEQFNPSNASAAQGAYMFKGITKAIQQANKLAKNLNISTNSTIRLDQLSSTLGTEGAVILPENASTYILAHELGHRAQDYHPVAGPSQLIGNIIAPFATFPVVTAVSAAAKTNRGAIAKGLLTSYALHAPRIAAEVTANRLGSEYLNKAGLTGTGKAQLLQPIGYALMPAAAAALPIAVGRAARTVSQEWKRRKEKKQQEQLANETQANIVY